MPNSTSRPRRSATARTFKNRWMFAIYILLIAVDLFIILRASFFAAQTGEGEYRFRPIANVTAFAASMVLNAFLVYLLLFLMPKLKWRNASAFLKVVKIAVAISGTLAISYGLVFIVIRLMRGDLEIPHYTADAVALKFVAIAGLELLYMLGEKYSPRFFFRMMMGYYTTPRNEERIIMFIDLRDSTPLSEQMGHEKYFLFIRDFIEDISHAAIRHRGDIYQYVGDEVIVTWEKKPENSHRAIQTLLNSRRNIQARSVYYRNKYGEVPEFRTGIHIGRVTIGEIGVVKKELAMSGEAVNITARIRTACGELNQRQIVSEDFFEYTQFKEWQGSDLGEIQLKGVENRKLRLYALKL